MTDDRNSVMEAIAYIDKRLTTIERAPRTWGSPESLELQTLLLLEVRSVLLRHSMPQEKPFAVRLAYIGFIKRQLKHATAEFFAPQLERLGRIDELPNLLAQFRDQVMALQKIEEPKAARASKDVGIVRAEDRPWLTKARGVQRIQGAPPRMGSQYAGVGR